MLMRCEIGASVLGRSQLVHNTAEMHEAGAGIYSSAQRVGDDDGEARVMPMYQVAARSGRAIYAMLSTLEGKSRWICPGVE